MTYPPTDLHTTRLLLRKFELYDVDDVFNYANDPEWARFLTAPTPYTREDAESFVEGNSKSEWESNTMFAIEFEWKVIGAIGFRFDAPNELAMLGYSIARPHWNKGLMTEAVLAVNDWAFEQFGLAKIYSFADVENVGSWRVMEKVGMTREGTLRSHGVLRGVRQDFHYYGILRSEWAGNLGREPQGMAEG